MKSLRITALSSLLVLCSALARAGSIPLGDPRVGVGGGGGSTKVGLSFTFTSATGTDTFFFQNGTDVTFTSLDFDVDRSLTPPLSCDTHGGIFFTGCGADFDTDGAIFTFFIDAGSGVPPGADFSVDVTGFPANTTFFAAANGAAFQDVPEPPSSALCLTSIVLLAMGRWMPKHGRSRA